MFDYNKYYDGISPIYNEIRLDPKTNFQATIDLIVNSIQNKQGLILDIGCGTGKYAQELEKHGFSTVGIDKSVSQINEAKKIIKALIADATNLPFDANQFDACLMIMMIHHMNSSERRQAFSEASRVLNDNGLLIIKTASHEDLKKRITSKFFPDTVAIDLVRYPEIDALQYELSEYFYSKVQNIAVEVSFKSEELYNKFALRRTSNLGMLTEKQLKEGLLSFTATFPEPCIIKKMSYNTFIIAKKK